MDQTVGKWMRHMLASDSTGFGLSNWSVDAPRSKTLQDSCEGKPAVCVCLCVCVCWRGGGGGVNFASGLPRHSNTAHMFHIETIALFHWAIWHRFLMFFSADHS